MPGRPTAKAPRSHREADVFGAETRAMNRQPAPPRSFPLPLLAGLVFAVGLGGAVTAGLSVGVGSSSVALTAPGDEQVGRRP